MKYYRRRRSEIYGRQKESGPGYEKAPKRAARVKKEEAIVYGPKGRATAGGYMVSEDGQILAKPK